MRVAVISEGEFLYRKIKLALSERAKVVRISSLADALGFDICLAEAAALGADGRLVRGAGSERHDKITVEKTTRALLMGEGRELPLPFTFEELLAAVEGEGSVAPQLMRGDRCAYLRGERIPLTEVEFALFDLLYSAGGEFVSREELLSRVWGDETDGGVVNVYIHYLRQKLERGEKIIFTSRSLGYKIDEKFFGGE